MNMINAAKAHGAALRSGEIPYARRMDESLPGEEAASRALTDEELAQKEERTDSFTFATKEPSENKFTKPEPKEKIKPKSPSIGQELQRLRSVEMPLQVQEIIGKIFEKLAKFQMSVTPEHDQGEVSRIIRSIKKVLTQAQKKLKNLREEEDTQKRATKAEKDGQEEDSKRIKRQLELTRQRRRQKEEAFLRRFKEGSDDRTGIPGKPVFPALPPPGFSPSPPEIPMDLPSETVGAAADTALPAGMQGAAAAFVTAPVAVDAAAGATLDVVV